MAIPAILKGDTSSSIILAIASGYDYTGCTLAVVFNGVRKEFTGLVAGGTKSLQYTADETAGMPLGTGHATLTLTNAAGVVRTMPWTRIRVTDIPSELYDRNIDIDPSQLDVTDATTADSLGAVKNKLNAVLAFLRGGASCVAFFLGLSCFGSIGPTTVLNDVPGDTTISNLVVAAGVKSIINAEVGGTNTLVHTGDKVDWSNVTNAPDFVTKSVTNGILVAAKEYADQYANQAPFYSTVSNMAVNSAQIVGPARSVTVGECIISRQGSEHSSYNGSYFYDYNGGAIYYLPWSALWATANASNRIARIVDIPTDYIPAAGSTNSVSAILAAARTDAQSKFKPFQSAVSQSGAASKTVTAFTQTTSGVASVTFGDIAIGASQVSGLAAVATSGSYNDLSNQPTIPTEYLKTAESTANSITVTKQDGTTTVGLTVNYEYALRNEVSPSTVTCVSGEIVSVYGLNGTLNVVFPAEVANTSADFIIRIVSAAGASQLGTLTITGGGTVTPEWLCDALTTTGKIASGKTTYIFFSRVAANTYVINAQEVK